MTKQTSDQSKRVKELKLKLLKLKEEFSELMSEFSDTGYNVELHMVIEEEYWKTDTLRLYSEIEIEDEDA